MNIPTNREIYHGEIATYWFEDDILVSLAKNPRRTLDNVSANVALVKHITQGKKAPLLIYLKPSPMPDKATRRFAAAQLNELYTAMAMVSKPGLAYFIMNIMLALNTPPIPMRHFTDDWAAKDWLREFL